MITSELRLETSQVLPEASSQVSQPEAPTHLSLRLLYDVLCEVEEAERKASAEAPKLLPNVIIHKNHKPFEPLLNVAQIK